MTWLRATIASALILLSPPMARGADGRLTLSEEAVNAVVRRLGAFSDSGLYQPVVSGPLGVDVEECRFFDFLDCPLDDPRLVDLPTGRIPLARCTRAGGGFVLVPSETRVPWQWWVQDARYEIGDGWMKFHATVRAMVGTEWQEPVEGEAPVSVRFDAASDRLLLEVGDFVVPVRYRHRATTQLVTEIDVGAMHSLSIAITPQDLQIPLLQGESKQVRGSVASATARFLSNKLEVDFDVEFQ